MPIRTVARPPAGNVAFAPTTQPTTRGGGRRSFNVRARVGTFNFPSAPGVVDVTGVGFTPKVLIPFGSQSTTDGNTTAVNLGIGAANNRGGVGWNLVRFSTDLTNSYWTHQNQTIAPNAGIGPSGANDMFLLTGTGAGTNAAYSAITPIAPGINYTFSVYVRKGTSTTPRLRVMNGASTADLLNIVLLWTGTVPVLSSSVGNIGPINIEEVSSGLFRVWTVFASGAETSFRYWLYQSNSNTTQNVIVSNPRIEVGSTPTAISESVQAAISCASQHSVTTTVASRRHSNTNVVSTLAGAGTLLKEAGVHRLTSDGFALNFSTASTARIFNHVCLGGDIEANIVECQVGASSAPESFAHGLSGAPTAILFFSIINPLSAPRTSTVLLKSVGLWSSNGQFCATAYAANNVATTVTRRSLSSGITLAFTTGSFIKTMAVSSVNATSVNVTYPVASADNPIFWMLCLRNCNARVGSFDLNGLTGPQTISLPGVTPRLFLPVLVPNGVSSLGSIVNGLNMTIGASDGTNTVSSGTSDQNGVSTTNARRWQSSNDLEEYDVNGNKIFDATVSFVGESIVVNPSLNTSGVGQGAYLVIGS